MKKVDKEFSKIKELFETSEKIRESFKIENTTLTTEIKIKRIYPKELLISLDILRYILEKEEISERGFILTKYIVKNLKNHYPSWIYRKNYLKEKKSEKLFLEEILFTEKLILKEPKGFQIWDHLKFCREEIGILDYKEEILFLQKVLDIDSRNYHCWSHRTWIVKRFNYFKDEIIFVKNEITKDVINNSLWSFYNFLLREIEKRNEEKNLEFKDDENKFEDFDVKKELEFVYEMIRFKDVNESSWNFLNSIYDEKEEYSEKLKNLCLEILEKNENNRFAYANFIFNEIRKKEKKDNKKIKIFLNKLKIIDETRKNFWNFYEIEINLDN